MGSVVSINAANDKDLFDSFAELCPPIPERTDLAVSLSGSNAVAQAKTTDGVLFRQGFLIVAALCIACLLVTLIVNQFAVPVLGQKTAIGDHPWRENRETWQAHIKILERDIRYQRVVDEKRLFAEKFSQ